MSNRFKIWSAPEKGINFLVRCVLLAWSIVLILLYLPHYGWQNFLWFSDIGLFLTVIALFTNSAFLISVLCLAILPAELLWNVEFLIRLITDKPLLGATDYMFDPAIPLFIRLLSLFHIALPVLWLYFLVSWRYDWRAFYGALILWVGIISVTYFVTDPAQNINWVFAPYVYGWHQITQVQWLLVLLFLVPLFIFFPLHYSYQRYIPLKTQKSR